MTTDLYRHRQPKSSDMFYNSRMIQPSEDSGSPTPVLSISGSVTVHPGGFSARTQAETVSAVINIWTEVKLDGDEMETRSEGRNRPIGVKKRRVKDALAADMKSSRQSVSKMQYRSCYS